MRAGEERSRKKEKEGGGKRKKRKGEKKMEKKKKGKRERDAAGFATAVGHACAAAFGRTATCTQIEEEQRDETAIGTGVETAKC